MRKRLSEIISELANVIKENELIVSPDTILDKAVSIYLTEKINSSKKESQWKQATSKQEPITEKQSQYLNKHDKELRKLGFDLNNVQYKDQAFKVISEHIKLKKKNE